MVDGTKDCYPQWEDLVVSDVSSCRWFKLDERKLNEIENVLHSVGLAVVSNGVPDGVCAEPAAADRPVLDGIRAVANVLG